MSKSNVPRTICLGNRAACTYRKHPQPPPGLPLDRLEQWADLVCSLDISDVPQVGSTIGDPGYTVTAAHRAALISDRIERPVLAAVLSDQKLCTTIHVSPSSTLLQALNECRTVWRGDGRNGMAHGQGTPAWIAGTWPALVALLADELGITEIREYNPEA